MRRIRLSPILSVVLLTVGTPALAQVTVDLHALQALPERATPTPAPRRVAPLPRPAPSPSAEAPTAEARPTHTLPPVEAPSAAPSGASAAATAPGTTPGTTASPAAQPSLPQSVPTVASIPPVPAPAEAAAPPPPPISDTATTKAEPEGKGLRLLFGAGQADLSPDSAAALKQLAASAPSADTTSFNVNAYAPGSRDDPSTARRLSLSRAMAVRSALVSDGVPSSRIYVRALGEAYGSGPADRVDVAVQGANADSTAQAAPK